MRGSFRALTAVLACCAMAAPAAAEPPRGTVPVMVTSGAEETPLQVGAYEGEGVFTDKYGRQKSTYDKCSKLCGTTPCTLHLPPGLFQICAADEHGAMHKFGDLEVPSTGADVRLRVASDAWAWVGAGFTMGGILLALASGVYELSLWDLGASAPPSSTSNTRVIDGLAMLAVSGGLLAIGIPVLVLNQDGVASVRPHASGLPSAKLTIGFGGTGVQGTF